MDSPNPQIDQARLGASMAAREGGRDFSDASGTVWRVYERPAIGQHQTTSLIFESTTALRRVKSYPSNWRSLSPDALERLSWER